MPVETGMLHSMELEWCLLKGLGFGSTGAIWGDVGICICGLRFGVDRGLGAQGLGFWNPSNCQLRAEVWE